MSDQPDLAKINEEGLWIFVASHLKARGISTVLTGGAVAAIYSEGAYTSGDLDFVIVDGAKLGVREAMSELGFTLMSGSFVHPECPHLFIEFVPGPLGIGGLRDVQTLERATEAGPLKILSPTDCVLDRMASFIHFRSRDCLTQAALVARNHELDWVRVETFCLGESPSGLEDYTALREQIERE